MRVRRVIAACAVSLVALGPTLTLRADEADDQFQVAAAHYQQQRWRLAASEFRAFLSEHAGDARSMSAQFYLGETLIQLGEYRAAADLFTAVRRSENAELARKALFRNGEANYLAGRTPEAQSALSAFCETYAEDPLNAYALVYRGEIALAAEQPAEAARLFQSALDRFPTGPLADDCRLGLARVCQQQGETDAARRRLADLTLTLGPRTAEAHYRLGTIDYAAGDYARADESFAAALRRAGSGPLAEKASLARGRTLYQLHKYDQAIELLERLTETESLSAEAHYWLGLTRKAQQDWDAAARSLAQAASTAQAPERQAAALAELAACLAATGQFDQARATYVELCAKQCSEDLLRPTTELLAAAALNGGATQWAQELFTALTAAGNPPATIATGMLGLARAQLSADMSRVAAETLARLIERYPDERAAVEAALLRGQVLERLDRPDEALRMYERVLALQPTTAQRNESLWRAARLNSQLGRWDAAAAQYEQLASGSGQEEDGDTVLYQWAWAVRRAGNRDQAQKLFARLLHDYPSSSLRAEVTCRLAEDALHERNYQSAADRLAVLGEQEIPQELRVRALYLTGQVAVAQEKWNDVAAPFKKLLALDPPAAVAAAAEFWIAEAAYRQGELVEAGQRFDALADRLPSAASADAPSWHALVPLRRAELLLQEGRFTEATDLVVDLSQKYPQFPQQYEADYIIGRGQAARAEFDEARQTYRQVIRNPAAAKTETAAKAQWMIGETYMHQRNYRAALAEYLKVEILYAFPRWQAAALMQAGKCHELLNEPAEAAAAYDRLLKIDADSTFREEAAQRLTKLRR